jgi:hypothetical protein
VSAGACSWGVDRSVERGGDRVGVACRWQAGQICSEDAEEELKQKQFKGILNKLTPDNFEKLTDQVGGGTCPCARAVLLRTPAPQAGGQHCRALVLSGHHHARLRLECACGGVWCACPGGDILAVGGC